MVLSTPTIENNYLNKGSIDYIYINISDDVQKTYNYWEINDFKNNF